MFQYKFLPQFLYYKHTTPYSFNANQNPSTEQRNKSLLEPSYFEFLSFPSHFQQFSYRVHKALVMKVAHFLNFPVMIADASFKLLHESSMFLTIIDRPLKKKKSHEDYTRFTFKKEKQNYKPRSEFIWRFHIEGTLSTE